MDRNDWLNIRDVAYILVDNILDRGHWRGVAIVAPSQKCFPFRTQFSLECPTEWGLRIAESGRSADKCEGQAGHQVKVVWEWKEVEPAAKSSAESNRSVRAR